MHDETKLKDLPGAEIVLPGLADLKAGRESVNASAVQAAAPRLRRAGIDAPSATSDTRPPTSSTDSWAPSWATPPTPATTQFSPVSSASPERPSVRAAADAERIAQLARELGRVVPPGSRMYLTGGATAVLEGWRGSTVDIDVRFEPDSDAALSRIRDLKEELEGFR